MHVWAFDVDGSSLKQRWHLSKAQKDYAGMRAGAHSMAILDLDGDGRDEIVNGGTVINYDGTVRWSAKKDFPLLTHHDGMYIDDIHPDRPGLEILLFSEQTFGKGPRTDYALYEAASGKLIWKNDASKAHLQSGTAGDYSGSKGLDIIGTTGGHSPNGWFAAGHDGVPRDYSLGDYPAGGDVLGTIDWDGARGKNFHNTGRVYGRDGKLLFQHGHSGFKKDASVDGVWWNPFDIVGDYREELLVRMKDGTLRAYLNTQTPPFKRRAKYQIRNYLTTQSVAGSHRHYKTAAGEPNLAPFVEAGADARRAPGIYKLQGTVIDDGKPLGSLTIAWSQVSGPGTVAFASPQDPQTTATFAEDGTYVLKLSASDGEHGAFDEVSITVGKPTADARVRPVRRARGRVIRD
jgi:hypothetical protein